MIIERHLWYRCHKFRLVVAMALFGAVWLLAAPAAAHKVTVFAWVEGDTVHTESKFSGGRFAKQARIEVYDSGDKLLLDGLTDDEGRFAFKPPKRDALRIVLVAGSGHRNEWRLTAEEISGLDPAPIREQTNSEALPQPESVLPMDGALSPTEMQHMIEASLDKKLQPVLRQLHRQEERTRLADILGGVGYILGLVGLGAYIHFRRRSSTEPPHAG
jgi:nickel transport protein